MWFRKSSLGLAPTGCVFEYILPSGGHTCLISKMGIELCLWILHLEISKNPWLLSSALEVPLNSDGEKLPQGHGLKTPQPECFRGPSQQ